MNARSLSGRLALGLALVAGVGAVALLVLVALEYVVGAEEPLSPGQLAFEVADHVVAPLIILLSLVAISGAVVIRSALRPLERAAREVDAAFDHGKTRNWFGGSSNASTQLLDGMHYRGLLRVARREAGVRLYAAREAHAPTDRDEALDRLADVVLQQYAPLPRRSLSELVFALRYGTPQWAEQRRAVLSRLLARSPQATVDGIEWVWPAGENPASARHRIDDTLRLLAPFDPVVWDRRRFEAFWGWAYRFEAYTPAAARQRGYYALPLLWRDEAIGWANLTWRDGVLTPALGYVTGRAPRDAGFAAALDEALDRMAAFLVPRD